MTILFRSCLNCSLFSLIPVMFCFFLSSLKCTHVVVNQCWSCACILITVCFTLSHCLFFSFHPISILQFISSCHLLPSFVLSNFLSLAPSVSLSLSLSVTYFPSPSCLSVRLHVDISISHIFLSLFYFHSCFQSNLQVMLLQFF